MAATSTQYRVNCSTATTILCSINTIPYSKNILAGFINVWQTVYPQQLNAPTCYSDNLALPGFHIFLFHPAFEQSTAKLHRDLQYRQHQWHEDQENNRHISFTLALKLPKFGGGMNIWDLHHREVDKLSQTKMESLALSRKKEFYPYQLGKLALHSGHFVHQIAPGKNMQPDDQRITLQGHGTCDRGVWHLYW